MRRLQLTSSRSNRRAGLRVRPLSPPGADEVPTIAETWPSYLVAVAAAVVFVVSLPLVAGSPSEKGETRAWVLAVCIALPAGVAIARAQERRGRATVLSAAVGTALLGVAMVGLRWGHADHIHHAGLAVCSLAAISAPFVLPQSSRVDPPTAWLAWGLAIAVLILPFVPGSVLAAAPLSKAIVLAELALVGLMLAARHRGPSWARTAADVVIASCLVLIVLSLPKAGGYAALHHHDFFLAPANDVAHGRPMLVETWSQYGVGLIIALRAMFVVVPIGVGGLILIVTTLTALQYLLMYLTLRAATGRIVLVVIGTAVSVAGHVFLQQGLYTDYPSTSPLRFGLPYLVVALAVAGARSGRWARGTGRAQLAVIAVAAVWSFESAVYVLLTYGAIILTTAIASGSRPVRQVMRAAAEALAVVVGAVLFYSLVTWVLAGTPTWGPYLDYIKLYTEGLGAVRVDFFSPGPLFGAVILLSASGVVWSALGRPAAMTDAERVAIAGFTGFAIATYTYYLGRSVENNLSHLLPPVAAAVTVWCSVALGTSQSHVVGRRAIAGVAAPLLVGAMVVVAAWPSVQLKWPITGFAQAVPWGDGHKPGSGQSFRTAVRDLWGQPVIDPRAPAGVALLQRHLPPGAPALVLAANDLSTEVLLRADRINVLPISNPLQDELIASFDERVRMAAKQVPAGTLVLTSDPDPDAMPGEPAAPARTQVIALDILHKRFRWRQIDRASGGLHLYRLERR